MSKYYSIAPVLQITFNVSNAFFVVQTEPKRTTGDGGDDDDDDGDS